VAEKLAALLELEAPISIDILCGRLAGFELALSQLGVSQSST
jgi:hypothetical protein